MQVVKVGTCGMALVWFFTSALPAHAGAMLKHIERVTPRIGQRGTTVEISIRGAHLDDPREELFIRCLARRPTSEELAGFQQIIPEPPANTGPYEDLVWALLNSTEFLFNH